MLIVSALVLSVYATQLDALRAGAQNEPSIARTIYTSSERAAGSGRRPMRRRRRRRRAAPRREARRREREAYLVIADVDARVAGQTCETDKERERERDI